MNLDSYPGANVIIHDRNVDEEIDFIPQVIQAGKDLPQSYAENCHQNVGEKEVIICEYGEIDNSKGTIALVGGSHSAHWLPALEIYANNNDMTILNITKSGCRFSTSEKPSSSEIDQEACRDWNNNVMEKLIELNPDLIFTTADASEIKGIPEGYIETWKKLEKYNINILAIKDNPRADFDIPTCIDINNRNSKECYIVNDMENLSDNVENLSLKNIFYIDLTHLFCEDNFCKPVIGNVLVYKDSNHITNTYSRTLSDALEEKINEAKYEFDKK